MPRLASILAPTTLVTLLTLACNPSPETAAPQEGGSTPEPTVEGRVPAPEFFRDHVRALSADEMQGRRPGTPGAEKAVAYLIAQMQALGLEPAGEDGKWTQTVPMRAVKTDTTKSALRMTDPSCAGKKRNHSCKPKVDEEWVFGKDWVGTTFAAEADHPIDAQLVFLGYGVTAPEYDWDDYAGVDMKGKIAVVFVGDPPVDDGRFGGKAMTYYGRWSYKFERAMEAGAAGCLVIHETEPASYGWNVPTSSYSGERFHVVDADGSVPAAMSLVGWISAETSQRLAGHLGTSLEAWHEAALDPKFQAQPTKFHLRGRLVTSERRTQDVNVLGKVPGKSRPDEAVIVTAHWDHLGVDADAADGEDAIYNGAVDNASGTAGLLGIAAGLQGRELARSVILFATTAEEQGLLGSRYYAAHPLVPAAKIAGVVNMDSINVHGPTSAVEVIGSGQSTMEDVLAEVVAEQGRRVLPESRPEAGGFYRSDHFPFAKIGVPALYFHAALETLQDGDPEQIQATRRANYHTVADELDESWSFEGTVQHVRTVLEVVARIADAEPAPSWKPASEFARIAR